MTHMVDCRPSERTMLWLARVAPYALLLILGGAVLMARRRPVTNAFVAFFVLVSCVAGFAQHDLWPFSAYRVIPESARSWRQAVWYEVRGVGPHGEAPIDASPLTQSVLDKWAERRFEQLAPSERDAVARFLLLRANSCRNDHLLGAFAAPDWLLHRGGSASGARTLRVYRNTVSQRTLVYEAHVE